MPSDYGSTPITDGYSSEGDNMWGNPKDKARKSDGAYHGALNARKAYVGMLKSDLEKMNEGRLGLSDTEKDKMAGASQAAAGRQAAARQTQLQRDAMAAGGGFSGEYAEAIGGMADVAGEQGARARQGADVLSQQIVDSKSADLKDRMSAERERRSKNKKEAIAQIETAVATIANMAAAFMSGDAAAAASALGEGAGSMGTQASTAASGTA